MGLEIRQSPGRGRGVFASRRFAGGDEIESCPVIVFSKKDGAGTVLHDYVFRWDQSKGTAALVLGYGSLYNHSYEPNAVYSRDYANDRMSFTALRTIKPGEEITVNYNGNPKCQDEVWFLAC